MRDLGAIRPDRTDARGRDRCPVSPTAHEAVQEGFKGSMTPVVPLMRRRRKTPPVSCDAHEARTVAGFSADVVAVPLWRVSKVPAGPLAGLSRLVRHSETAPGQPSSTETRLAQDRVAQASPSMVVLPAADRIGPCEGRRKLRRHA